MQWINIGKVGVLLSNKNGPLSNGGKKESNFITSI